MGYLFFKWGEKKKIPKRHENTPWSLLSPSRGCKRMGSAACAGRAEPPAGCSMLMGAGWEHLAKPPCTPCSYVLQDVKQYFQPGF